MHEERQRHDQNGRIEDVNALITLSKEPFVGVPSTFLNLFVDLVTSSNPSRTVGSGKGTFVGETDSAIESDPEERTKSDGVERGKRRAKTHQHMTLL